MHFNPDLTYGISELAMHGITHTKGTNLFIKKSSPFYTLIILYSDNYIADTDEFQQTKWKNYNLDRIHIVC